MDLTVRRDPLEPRERKETEVVLDPQVLRVCQDQVDLLGLQGLKAVKVSKPAKNINPLTFTARRSTLDVRI